VDETYDIRRLRWRVTIGKRAQDVAGFGNGVAETLINPVEVWADIEPVGGGTFWGSAQIDTPITDRIIIRWIGLIDNTWVVLRNTNPAIIDQPPLGTLGYFSRFEIFRVRRASELGGRKRFTMLEVEKERVG
jgi:head-tail adaptor